MKIEFLWDLFNVDRMDRSVLDKNGEVIMVNGVYEDMLFIKIQVNLKFELVIVKEGYSLVVLK